MYLVVYVHVYMRCIASVYVIFTFIFQTEKLLKIQVQLQINLREHYQKHCCASFAAVGSCWVLLLLLAAALK